MYIFSSIGDMLALLKPLQLIYCISLTNEFLEKQQLQKSIFIFEGSLVFHVDSFSTQKVRRIPRIDNFFVPQYPLPKL